MSASDKPVKERTRPSECAGSLRDMDISEVFLDAPVLPRLKDKPPSKQVTTVTRPTDPYSGVKEKSAAMSSVATNEPYVTTNSSSRSDAVSGGANGLESFITAREQLVRLSFAS